MVYTICQILVLGCLAPAVTLFVRFLDQHGRLGKLNYWARQIIIGVLFGITAVITSERGITINNAQMNFRDASVLTAGLLFGGPAGVIAGLIGGIERWFAVYWGLPAFTRTACAIATCSAGFIVLVFRRFIYDNKFAAPGMAIICAVITEVFHFFLVFVTNMKSSYAAVSIIHKLIVPMIFFTALIVWVSCVIVTGKTAQSDAREKSSIILLVRSRFFTAFLGVFLFSITMAVVSELYQAKSNREQAITDAMSNMIDEVEHISDEDLLGLGQRLTRNYKGKDLRTLASLYGLTEISIINYKGIIEESTDSTIVGFDMRTGTQSAAFLCLLEDTDTFIQPYGPIAKDPNIYRKYAGFKIPEGFIQIGLSGEDIRRGLSTSIKDMTKYYTLGYAGGIVILNGSFDIVSTGFPTNAAFPEEFFNNAPRDITRVHYNDTDFFAAYDRIEEYYIIAMIPVEESFREIRVNFYDTALTDVLLFAVLFFIIFTFINRQVIKPLDNVTVSLGRISDGNLDEVVDVRGNWEFDNLSDDINTTVNTLKQHAAEARQRIEGELRLASTIQASCLVHSFPNIREVDFYANMQPAKEVGGDFYDIYISGPSTVTFAVADVSGKGIPAAMFMMRAMTELKSISNSALPLNGIIEQANSRLCEGNDAEMFITAWQGNINYETGLVQYVNAGHNPPLVKHADGSTEYLRKRSGFVLGAMEDLRYKLLELQLRKGDILFLYTDGVTEAENESHELYGEDRLQRTLEEIQSVNPLEICKLIRTDMEAFVGNAPQFDDCTMLALHYIGKPDDPTIRFEEASIQDVTAACDFVEGLLSEKELPIKLIHQFNIAIDEVFSNIVKYAYPNQPGALSVTTAFREDPKRLELSFEDYGIPFNPIPAEDPDITLSAEERKIGGLGIFIVKRTMDDMRYVYEDGKNKLTLVKYL